MAAGYLPLAAAAVTLLVVATSAIPVAAAKFSGRNRMVIIRAPGARVVSPGGALNNKWQQWRRLVEDDVAPEFGGGGGQLVGGADGNSLGLVNDRPVCLHNGCAQPGQRYTPGHCTYKNGCPHTPTTAERAGPMQHA
ncbi:hypothetical protein Zm00014a_026037 [Zea mays]|jgi:hypothetical protein|uniref:Uncharacterized protein n=1 Tax=Zea mays TaxID=4577 RepID=A0A3L6FMG2_MAIZE|nr:hypothetical protein Zm00014a_026037 [Zea mays]